VWLYVILFSGGGYLKDYHIMMEFDSIEFIQTTSYPMKMNV